MFEKIVRRVAPSGTADPESDLTALIDCIEIELGLSTGSPSARNRLSGVVSEIRRAEGVVSQESVNVLLDIVERLRKIEGLLRKSGFETAVDTTQS
jgi:hypothetical protein